MSKVLIKQLTPRHYGEQVVMSWDEYVEFAKTATGEGVTWEAVLI